MSTKNILKSENDKISKYPAKYEVFLKLKNGKKLLIRPVKPNDERMVQRLHFSLDKQDWYYRFFSYNQNFRNNGVKPLVNINYNIDMVLVAEYIKKEENYIVGMGGFFKKLNPRVGELIFITHNNWRSLGITKFLLKYLIKIARDMGFTKLGGCICVDNKPMHHILNSGEYKIISKDINNSITAVLLDITV